MILQFKFFPTDRALSILRGKTGENFPNETVLIFNNKMRAVVCYCIRLRPVPEWCNKSIPGINVPGIRYIYSWNRVITPFRNWPLEYQ